MMVDFEQIKDDVISQLSNGLPRFYTYHDVNHTLYVLEQSQVIGLQEGLNKSELDLLKIAALYHDIGYLVGPEEHEKTGCGIAQQQLPACGISEKEIEQICGMIMATRIPQTPQNKLEMVLADADLEYLGSTEFTPVGDKLYREVKHFRPDLSEEQWDEIQIDFLENHQFHTAYCQEQKEAIKQKNLQSLREKYRLKSL